MKRRRVVWLQPRSPGRGAEANSRPSKLFDRGNCVLVAVVYGYSVEAAGRTRITGVHGTTRRHTWLQERTCLMNNGYGVGTTSKYSEPPRCADELEQNDF